jgi:hypothetical protein
VTSSSSPYYYELGSAAHCDCLEGLLSAGSSELVLVSATSTPAHEA